MSTVNRRSPSKIKRIWELAKIAANLKKEGKKIVLCHGVFDLVHPGHIRHFSSAKKYGDVLIVTLTSDKFVNKGPGRPIFRQELRGEVLSSLSQVDYVAIVDSDSAIEPIKRIKPDFYVKGPDYKKRKPVVNLRRKLQDEEKAVSSIGGKLIFTEDEIIFSSSKLINEHLSVYPTKTENYLSKLKQKYSVETIFEMLSTLCKLKVLIIGDAIIDQYHYCVSLGKSTKEPVMVNKYVNEETFIGGTLATANHCASLSDNITLVSMLGEKNSFRQLVARRLKDSVKSHLFLQDNIHTIVKRRYVDAFTKQKLFQIAYLTREVLDKKIEKKILAFLKDNIASFDAVIVNDFGHGLMSEPMIRLICRQAKYLALNVQANSANYGFNIVTKYPRADFVCIDEQEIRLATHEKLSDVYILIKKIYKRMRCQTILVTKGQYGAIGYQKETGFVEAPSLTERIVDRVGAGDAFYAITSVCMVGKLPLDLIAFLGNVAASIKIAVVGNKKQIEYSEMVKFVTRLLK